MIQLKDSINSSHSSCGVMILAAGLGKRMRSPLPKVLHEIVGKPMLFHVLQQVYQAIPDASVGIVVGHGRDQVEAFIQNEPVFQKMKITFILQPEQRGTGHAARCAMDSEWGNALVQHKTPIVVLPGDLPLIRKNLIEQLSESLAASEALRLLTCELPDPTGYGRILRDPRGKSVEKIVEEKDASLDQRKIREVAASIYFFQSEYLKSSLQSLSSNNAQGEYYLTDLVEGASKTGKKVAVLTWKNPGDLRGVNDLWELAQADRFMNERFIREWALKGVRFLDPLSTRIESTVELSEGCVVHPGVILTGSTRVGSNTVIGPRVILKNMEVGDHVELKAGTIGEKSTIDSHAVVGPYAHLRPDSHVGSHAKIGNFVELKKTKVGESTSIAHLSYLGDAEVGKNVNIGCGFITCNYDGRVINGQRKHRTIIEDDVFLGSDCQTVAPVKVGKGSFVASGSTITEDVEPGSLAIARSRQVNKPGYALKLKQSKE